MKRILNRLLNPSSWSIRWRLTLWYLSGILVILTISGVLAYYGFRAAIIADTDRSLTIKATEIIIAITEGDSLKHKGTYINPPLSPSKIAQHSVQAFSGLQFDSSGDQIYLRLLHSDSGIEVTSSKNILHHGFVEEPLLKYTSISKLGSKAFFVGSGEHELRIMLIPVPRSPYTLQLATQWSRNEKVLNPLIGTIEWIEGFFLVISAIGCWILIGRTMQPINELVLEAGKLRGDRLEPGFVASRTYGEDEIGHLVTALNAMMYRVHKSVEIQRQFTADASHDLRTPLTILRGELEFALARERTPKEYQEALQTALNAADRLIRIVSDLDELAVADAEEIADPNHGRSNISPAELCQTVINARLQEASTRDIKLKFSANNLENATVYANPLALERAIANVIDNAIKYNVQGGTVNVMVFSAGGCVVIEVADTGIGISESDQPFIFDRFYRADKSRKASSQDEYSSNSGLGLAIAQYVISSIGGSLEVKSKVNKGSRFTISLPVSSESVSTKSEAVKLLT